MNVAAEYPPPLPSKRGLGCLGWSLILAGICVATCAGVGFLGYRWVSNAFTTDAARVREITAKIADFTPPDTLRPIFGLDMNFGMNRIQAGFFAAEEGLPLVILKQFTGMSAEDARSQLDDNIGRQMKNFVPKTRVERPVTVHGQQVTATIQTGEWRGERVDAERQPSVKAAACFEGRGGTANVIVLVPGNDDAAVDAAVGLIETVR